MFKKDMQKMATLLLAVCSTSACKADTKSRVVTEPEISVAGNEVLDYQASVIAQSIVDTSYSALIQVTSIDVINLPDDDKTDDYSEQKFVYHAHVIETFRGETKKNITYVMFVEGGEQPRSYKNPLIITLCHSNDEGFYWPGVGSDYLAHNKLKSLAREAGEKANKNQTRFNFCDE
jgi:hypothetical protein